MPCEPAAAVTPEPIHNRPGLSAIDYRVGTYATFRRAMLRAISRARRSGQPAGGDPLRPLEEWTTRAPDDFGIAFIEMWAYVGDVLTFYQERIANEAYLRTGVRDRSTTDLASLIGYRPTPGRAAAAWLAFQTDEDAEVSVPQGLKVQSVPGQDEKPQKFETLEKLEAVASLNVLRPRTLERQVLNFGARRAVLAGTGHELGAGDWIAVAGDERRSDAGSERWDLRRLEAVAEDEDAGTTTVRWSRGLGAPRGRWHDRIEPDPNPEFWVFRRTAWPFGYNAPDYNLFATTLPPSRFAAFKNRYENWEKAYLPQDTDHEDQIYLDTVYPDLVVGGWVALVTSRIDPDTHPKLKGYDQYAELYPIKEVAHTAYTAYTLSGRVTRLTTDVSNGKPENIGYFPLRGTVALVGSERIRLADVPLGHSAVGSEEDVAKPIAGDTIELDDRYPDLRPGRMLLVTGKRSGAAGAAVEDSEAVRISSVDHSGERTTVTLTSPLKGSYVRASVRIYGNVAAATHGESVSEVLGDGDASQPFQSFQLGKSPVTYVPKAGAPGGVASTLEVRVGGVLWQERPELYGQAGDARVFITRRRPGESRDVLFGDGLTGALLPSGRSHVAAAYRVGHGPEGNVGARSLRTLLKKPLGLKSVTNPAPAAGGTAAEGSAAVKETAPGTVRTFGRIVSLRDFEDAALEYVGIAKARASWRWDGEQRVVDLVVAGESGASAAPLLGGLQADLDARRDPYRPLRIRDFTRLPVSVEVEVLVDEDYLLEDVRKRADAVLRGRFAFSAVDLGETVHLSDLHEAVMRAEGVLAVDLDVFRFKRAEDRAGRGGDGAVQPRLLVGPGELVWVADATDLRITNVRFPGREGP